MKRKAAVLIAPKHIEIVEQELPALEPDQVLYRVISGGLCHSELPTYFGKACTEFGKYHYKSYTKGVQFPRGVGHEPVCVVEEVGRNVKKFTPGDLVTGYIGKAFASHLIAKTDGIVKIPKTGKPVEHCLGEPLSCVANIVRAAQPQYGDTVAVIGCGVMGLLAIRALAGSAVSHLVAVDLDDSRLETAVQYGATDVLNPGKNNAEDAIYALTEGRGADVVVEISGSLRALGTALQIIRIPERYSGRGRGKIIMGSLYGKEAVFTEEIGFNLMLRSPELHSVHPVYSYDHEEDVRRGVEGYINDTMPIDKMVSHTFRFEEIDRAFAMLASGDPTYKKGVVLFD